MERYNLVSFAGIFILLGVAWLLSNNRKKMNWHVIGWGLGLQLIFALFIFLLPAGKDFFLGLNDIAVKVIQTSSTGAEFLFGPLAKPPGTEGSMGFFLAFQALPTIIFFSAFVAILYHYNILPRVIRWFAWLFTKLMRVSGAESLCTASNIFVGVESAFTVRPHIERMTSSELHTILTAGMATVASNVLALYVYTLTEQFPSIAGHLISASLLSAPAALIMSKILYPEVDSPETLGQSLKVHYTRENNLFEAIIKGSQAGVRVIVGIVALLIAVLGLVALADLLLGLMGGTINNIFDISIDWSLKGLLGYLFYPFTLIIGIPFEDAGTISKIIGERIIVTEVASYQDLAAALDTGLLKYHRSAVIATYALCGFAHVASMAIFVGGISALAPNRTSTLSKIAARALTAATLACLLTACVAGTFYTKESILLR